MLKTFTYTYIGFPTHKYLEQADIKPSEDATYTLADITAAVKKGSGVEVTVGCEDGELATVKYIYRANGSWENHDYVAPEEGSIFEVDDSCPATGIK